MYIITCNKKKMVTSVAVVLTFFFLVKVTKRFLQCNINMNKILLYRALYILKHYKVSL